MSALLRAIGVLALGKLLFASQDAIIKQMSGAFPMHEIMTIRGLTAIPVLLLLIGFSVGLAEIRRHHPGYHVLRDLMMFVAFMAFYVGLAEISLTTATALFFTAPPAVMSLYASLAFLVLAPLAGLVFAALDPGAATRPGASALHPPWALPRGLDLALLALTGVTSALGFICTSNAYQRAEASRVAPFEYVIIVWVTALSFLIWDEVPDAPTIAGVVIIILSGIYVLRREAAVAEVAAVPPR